MTQIGRLVEGSWIRCIERMTGVHWDTIMRLCPVLVVLARRLWCDHTGCPLEEYLS